METCEAIMKKQLFWTRLCAIFLAVLLVLGLVFTVLLVPTLVRIEKMLDKLDQMTDDLAKVTGELSEVDWKGITEDLTEVSEQLSQISWTELTGNINGMALDAQKSIKDAMAAIDSLDIDQLNEAIADLKKVVEPLAKLVGSFG